MVIIQFQEYVLNVLTCQVAMNAILKTQFALVVIQITIHQMDLAQLALQSNIACRAFKIQFLALIVIQLSIPTKVESANNAQTFLNVQSAMRINLFVRNAKQEATQILVERALYVTLLTIVSIAHSQARCVQHASLVTTLTIKENVYNAIQLIIVSLVLKPCLNALHVVIIIM